MRCDMEVGVLGSPCLGLIAIGASLGSLGLIFLIIAVLLALLGFLPGNAEGMFGVTGLCAVVALALLASSTILLFIGLGRQSTGYCFDRLPATTLDVDVATALNEDVLYIAVRGKNKAGDIVRKCATLPMSSVSGYPGHPVGPGEYKVVVIDHEANGTNYMFWVQERPLNAPVEP